MNQEDGFSLRKMWNPHIHFLKKKRRQPPKINCLALLTQYYLTGTQISKTSHSPPSSKQTLKPSAKHHTCTTHTIFIFLTVCNEPFVTMAVSLQTLNSQQLSTRSILSSLFIALTSYNPHNLPT